MSALGRKWFKRTSTGDIIIHAVLIVMGLIFLLPFIYIVSASFSSPSAIAANPFLFYPKGFNLEAYKLLFSVRIIWQGYINSIFYMSTGTTLNVVLTLLAGYALSKSNLPGRNIITIFFLVTMFFSGGMIPSYLLIRDLRMLDTRWAMILPGAISTWNMLVTRAFMQNNVPQDLSDAAVVDGASEFLFFRKIVLPLSLPITVVMILFYSSGHWNSWFNAFLYIRNSALYPLQLTLMNILVQGQMGDMAGSLSDDAAERLLMVLSLKYAIMVAALFPMMITFPFVQKYFVKGVMIGALKE
ncbi:MAG: carbohydrate ABC transporter permease [Treponema sp.]|jgi:ABC-type glycerol-3-phosphate transport system permease component|nr:carbohydrate ABC transporter permease [Treponema sp.]